MNAYKIYTRKTMGLDNRVWRLLFAVIILPLGLLSYRLMDKKKCIPFSFTERSLGIHKNDIFYTGETISFIASAPSDDISWDFNDNITAIGATVYHQFLKEGTYVVIARSNSLCETEKQITVTNPPPPPPKTITEVGSIAGPTSCYTFTEQIFTWPGSARSFVWSIPDHQSLGMRTGQTIKYTFPYEGKYTLQVELDSDRTKRYTLEVLVQEKPKPVVPTRVTPGDVVPVFPKPGPLKPPVPDSTPHKADSVPPGPKLFITLDNMTFLEHLKEVQTGNKTVQNFEKYGILPDTKVIVNGDDKDLKTFSWLCGKISKKKGKILIIGGNYPKLKSAELSKMNGVVTLIKVNYK